ncbi:hypothetical protein C0995_007292 [Termitomyces sp. Mi166|nr:hypothetical protein C0995_007292 [Termitomyces sp. Mi166\
MAATHIVSQISLWRPVRSSKPEKQEATEAFYANTKKAFKDILQLYSPQIQSSGTTDLVFKASFSHFRHDIGERGKKHVTIHGYENRGWMVMAFHLGVSKHQIWIYDVDETLFKQKKKGKKRTSNGTITNLSLPIKKTEKNFNPYNPAFEKVSNCLVDAEYN